MIGKFIVAYLSAQSAVTAILGSSPLRMWPDAVPEEFRENWPRGVFTELSDTDITDELTGPGEVWLAEYQLTFSARGVQMFSSLSTLKAAVIGNRTLPKLHHYEGGTLGGVQVLKVRLSNSVRSVTSPDENSDYSIRDMFLDFSFWYVRA